MDERCRARLLCKALNGTGEDEPAERARILKELIPNAGADLWLQCHSTATMGRTSHLRQR
ncbi:maltose acetyltransferase domain-containing protein [Geotalea sp. SG265]|uniref:maltose acetyltransferase domain-containing protein n=1 Tax=Geotalea sp. SG265 TaxID=2922867 RepID=UPI00325FB45D